MQVLRCMLLVVFALLTSMYMSGCDPVDTMKSFVITSKDSNELIAKKVAAATAQTEIEKLKQDLELSKEEALKKQFDATLWHKAALAISTLSGLAFIICLMVVSLRKYCIYPLAGFGVALGILAIARLHDQYPWLETLGMGVIGIPLFALAVYETIIGIKKDKLAQAHEELAKKLVTAIDAPEDDIKMIQRDNKLLDFYKNVSSKAEEALKDTTNAVTTVVEETIAKVEDKVSNAQTPPK